MIKTVFLDMDGVLVDFNKAATAIIGAKFPPKKWHWYKDIKNGFELVNNACTTDFWSNLDWMHDGHDILRLITAIAKPEQTYLFTTPMPNPESATGKTLWVEKHLPEYKKRLIITQAPKSLFAKPDILLIDDKTENVDEFIEAGGYGLLVPRPWNIDYGMADYTTQIVEERLEDYPICQ